jgi:hypothetical protein
MALINFHKAEQVFLALLCISILQHTYQYLFEQIGTHLPLVS